MMKKEYLSIMCLLFVLTSVCGQIKESDKKWTVQEVQVIAKKYNLQGFEISESKNNLLLFFTKQEIENYFKNEVYNQELALAYNSFKEKNKSVRTYDDYFKLLDQLPIVKKDVVQAYGGVDKYARFKQNVLKSNWRIYRSSNGDLRFFKANTPIISGELKTGQRIDNLPKE